MENLGDESTKTQDKFNQINLVMEAKKIQKRKQKDQTESHVKLMTNHLPLWLGGEGETLEICKV